MSRGPRAEASRTVARRSIRALAQMVDELLTTTGQHTARLARAAGLTVDAQTWGSR